MFKINSFLLITIFSLVGIARSEIPQQFKKKAKTAGRFFAEVALQSAGRAAIIRGSHTLSQKYQEQLKKERTILRFVGNLLFHNPRLSSFQKLALAGIDYESEIVLITVFPNLYKKESHLISQKKKKNKQRPATRSDSFNYFGKFCLFYLVCTITQNKIEKEIGSEKHFIITQPFLNKVEVKIDHWINKKSTICIGKNKRQDFENKLFLQTAARISAFILPLIIEKITLQVFYYYCPYLYFFNNA